MDEIASRVIEAVRPYTSTPPEAIEATVALTLDTIDAGVEGDLVECGTWMGGLSYAMLLAQRFAYGEIKRPVWMYDSFQGMSPPSEVDGADDWYRRASTYPRDVPTEGACICPLPYVLKAIGELELGGYALVRPGWLDDTLPRQRPTSIAVLRVDCDWYRPVQSVLVHLCPLVSHGGVIILDDYHAWAGCRLATHEYLEEQGRAWPIQDIANKNGAWMKVDHGQP